MIIIEKNSTNTCVFTLNENQTVTDHDWVFVFTHDFTGEVKTFTATDISTYPRFNEFVITDNTTENLFNGTVDLAIGDHTYKVYEMTQGSPADLDVNNALAMVEQGKVSVIDTDAIEPNYFDTDDTKNSGEFTG